MIQAKQTATADAVAAFVAATVLCNRKLLPFLQILQQLAELFSSLADPAAVSTRPKHVASC